MCIRDSKQPGYERQAAEVPGEMRHVVMDEMGADETCVFTAAQDGHAVVWQRLAQRRTQPLDGDEQEREHQRRAPRACAQLRHVQQLRETSQVHACAGPRRRGLL